MLLKDALAATGRAGRGLGGSASRQQRGIGSTAVAAGLLQSCSASAPSSTGRHHMPAGGGRALAPSPSPSPGGDASGGPRRGCVTNCLCDTDAPEAHLVKGANIRYNDSSALRLRRRALMTWKKGSPSKVLIVKKPKNPEASVKMQEIGRWLAARGMQVYVEKAVHSTEFQEFDCFDGPATPVDFCITLGGDGTVLYLASLFEEDVPLPPVLCFAMGTLGFLTPFDVSSFQPCLERVLDTSQQPLYCTLRTRKRCEVVVDGRLEAVHHVLNECVLDRGSFPGAVLVEIFVDGTFVTNVEADGLIISTPSGSTAYSMSAGGPVVAPSVPCTILTPIAPLSLSFRPVVIPESSSLCIHLPTCARSHARASFDGKRPMRVRRGTSIFFTTSLCPLPVISLGRMDSDWYEGITSKLKWNTAIRELPRYPSMQGTSHQAIGEQLMIERSGLMGCSVLSTSLDGDSPYWEGQTQLQQEQQHQQQHQQQPHQQLGAPLAAEVAAAAALATGGGSHGSNDGDGLCSVTGNGNGNASSGSGGVQPVSAAIEAAASASAAGNGGSKSSAAKSTPALARGSSSSSASSSSLSSADVSEPLSASGLALAPIAASAAGAGGGGGIKATASG